MFHLFDACLYLNHAMYLVFVSNAESVNLTFGSGIENVQIDHRESEMKEIHCSCRQCSETSVLCVATSHHMIPVVLFIPF